MRILHTADWHLTEKLGPIDRRPDLIARLQEIATYLDEYRVDVMVVAGDIFSQCTSRDVSGTVENYINEKLANHPDREEVLKLARELLATLE